MAVVDVVHLRRRYGSTIAVDDVSFTVADGEIFGLLGPNGAGKTTTVEAVVGLRVPDAGTIRVLGLDPLLDRAALRERVGVQLQESALPPKLRLGEALSLYASFYRRPEDPQQLLETLGLAAKTRAFFKDLSGGQKQRLSIALALVGRPTVAVLDELTTGLDPRARRDTWQLVEAVRGRGVTVVLVTHDMDEAQHLCDRVALVDAGRVIAVDTPTRLAERASGGKRMRFRPSAPFGDALLTRLPDVSGLDHDGGWVVVTGGDDLVHAVIATLAAAGVTAHDVTTESGALEDAFLALTGHGTYDASANAAPEPAGRREYRQRAFRGWRATLHRSPRGLRPPRSAFARLVTTEARLAVRNPVGLVWGVGFPILLLMIFGSIPATNKPQSVFGGLTFFQIYLPVILALGLALLALIGLPVPLTSYRELGVLRRMSTTPVPPSWLLAAQFVVNFVLFALAALVIVLVGAVIVAGLPVQALGLMLSSVLALAAMFSLGLCVAAVAPNQRAAGAIGAVLFYPSAFFAGAWLPREVMSPTLRTVSGLMPLGAAVHAMDISMLTGRLPPADALLVMLGWTAVFGWLAVHMFRWE